MNLIAVIPPGVAELTVNGLHQWDYGRKLEIHSADLQGVVEVHFACPGMKEAVVRSCGVVDGVAEAAIPDKCLEQTAPITAWVVSIGETSSATVKTIHLTVTARAKPQPGDTVPEEAGNRYTDAIQAMNDLVQATEDALDDAVDELAEEFTAPNGPWVSKAKYAENAGRAANANLLKQDCVEGDVSSYALDEEGAGLYIVNVLPTEGSVSYSILLSIDNVNATEIRGTEKDGVSAVYFSTPAANGRSRVIKPIKDGEQMGTIKSVFKIASYSVDNPSSAYTIAGIWLFADNPTVGDGNYWSFGGTFTSNGQEFTGLYAEGFSEIDDQGGGGMVYYAVIKYGTKVVYHTASGWADEAYKTVNFGSSPQSTESGFDTWFRSNAIFNE